MHSGKHQRPLTMMSTPFASAGGLSLLLLMMVVVAVVVMMMMMLLNNSMVCRVGQRLEITALRVRLFSPWVQ